VNYLVKRAALPVAILSMILLLLGEAPAQNLQRGYENYQAIVLGEKKYDELTPEEQEEVIRIWQLLSASGVSEGGSEECQDARSNADIAADDLERRAKKLLACARARDFDDDCHSEFRRVKRTQSDYEGAVSEVQSYCE